MRRKYKFRDNFQLYFVSFATVNWIELWLAQVRQAQSCIRSNLRYAREDDLRFTIDDLRLTIVYGLWTIHEAHKQAFALSNRLNACARGGLTINDLLWTIDYGLWTVSIEKLGNHAGWQSLPLDSAANDAWSKHL